MKKADPGELVSTIVLSADTLEVRLTLRRCAGTALGDPHCRVVDADPASTYHALRNTNLLGACMSVLLVGARDLPNRQRTRRNGHTQPGLGNAPSTVRFADVTGGDSVWGPATRRARSGVPDRSRRPALAP